MVRRGRVPGLAAAARAAAAGGPLSAAEDRPEPSLLAVFERELLRGGRRWQTWGLRALFAGVLLFGLLVVWSVQIDEAAHRSSQAAAELGRTLVRGYGLFQLLALAAITPVVVAQGVIEERDGGTLPLLAITRLRPARIVLGRLASRLISLLLLALAGLPLLALASSLGGVELALITNLGLQSVTVVVTTGCLASFLGLFAKSPFPAAMQVWTWCFGAWVIAPGPYVFLRMVGTGFNSPVGYGELSPLTGLFQAQGLTIGLPLLANLPTAVGAIALAAAGFRAMVAGADDPIAGFGTLSSDFEPLRRMQRWIAVGAVVLVVSAIPAWFAVGLPSPAYLMTWAWFALAAAELAGLLLLMARWVGLRRQRKEQQVPLKSSAQLIREWESVSQAKRKQPVRAGPPKAAPPPAGEAGAWGSLAELGNDADEAAAWGDPLAAEVAPVAPARSLSGRRARRPARLTRSRRLPLFKKVWDDSVLWRELATRAWGGLGSSFRRLYVFLGVGPGILLLLAGVEDPEAAFVGAVMAMVFALAITMLAATSTLIDELRRGTLELLLVTPRSPASILRSKLMAVAAYAAPAWAAAVLLTLPAMEVLQAGNLERLAVFVSLTAWSAAVLTLLAVAIQTLSLRLRTPPRIWAGVVLLCFLQLIGPLIAFEMVEGVRPLEAALQLWVPLATPRIDVLFVAASTGLWAVVALIGFVQNARLLRRVAGG